MTKTERKQIAAIIADLRTNMDAHQHATIVREFGRWLQETTAGFDRDAFDIACGRPDMILGEPKASKPTSYDFEPYDIIQILRDGGEWLDFSTIRTQQDAAMAKALVDAGQWNGRPETFAIVSPMGTTKYVKQ